jgi:hypothetical protein
MALRRVAEEDELNVTELARSKWQSSGLSDVQAKKLGLVGMAADRVAALGSSFHEAPALHIPYFDLLGKKTGFFRVRYLGPLPGFAGQLKRPPRFTQPRELNEIYLPPLFKQTWKEMASDTSIPIYITEGELKAAAGCAAGLATVGLGGVDVWRASKRGVTFLPLLEKFTWKDRNVHIVYDSDVATKPDVIRAQRSLAQELLSRGARIAIVGIPVAESGAKQGLDDYLVASGADALAELIENAPGFPESDALWGLNEEIVYVRSMDSIAERNTGRLIRRFEFIGGVYANRHYMETVIKKKQVSLVKKPLAPRWMGWEERAEVEAITFEPGKEQMVDGMWNVWPGWGCDPKKGDIGPWLWLLDFLFKDEHKIRKWFERWLAYPLQHPGAKMYAACLLWSREQRIGKSFIAYILKGIYGKNWVEIKSKDLRGNFNSWAKNRQFVYGDEIKGNDAKVDADWFKGLITQDEVTIEEKFLPKYSVPDHMNYYCSSNHPDALFLEDRDQRFLIHEIKGKPAERKQYEKLDHWMRNGGPAALFHHYLDANLGDFNPREHAPETPGKMSMIMLGKTGAAIWCQMLKENPDEAMKVFGELGTVCDIYTPRQLYKAFDPEGKARDTEASLGRALAHAGFHQLNYGIPLRTKSMGIQRLYCVRNQSQWETAHRKAITDHFDKFWVSDAKERRL